MGWIKFDDSNGGVTINATTGDFDGYAWAENIGWIHFQNASPDYKVALKEQITVTITQSVSESGTTANGTVSVPTNVTSDLTVNLVSNDLGEATVLATTIISSGQNSTTFTITGVDDTELDGNQTPIITASHADYMSGSATITVQDNDTPGVTVSGTPTIVEAGATGTYTLTLNTTPTGNVTIGITPDAQCTVSSSSVNLSNTTASTITVTAFDDSQVEGNHSCTISHAITASADGNYPTTMSILDATANITDDDPGVVITQSSGNTAVTEGGTTDSYTVKLSTAPTDTVTVTITADAQTTASPATLTFNADTTALNPQTVTVTAVDDTTVENAHSSTISHSSVATNPTNDPNYDGGSVVFMVDGSATSQVSVSITDNDNPPVPTPTPTPSATDAAPVFISLAVEVSGNGSGRVESKPAGIDCATADMADSASAPCEETFLSGTTVQLTAIPDPGSELSSWGGVRECADGELLLSGSRLCTAFFKLLPQTLTVAVEGEGTVTSIPLALDCGGNNDKCAAPFTGGSRVTLREKPAAGWALQAWEGDCDEQGRVAMLTSQTCQALFVPISELVVNPPEEVTVPPDSVETLPTMPPEPVQPENLPMVTTPPENLPEMTSPPETSSLSNLTIEISGNGKVISQPSEAGLPTDINCGNDCTADLPMQTKVTLSAMPMPGFQFSHWEQDCQGAENPLTFTLHQAESICTAIFEALPAELINTPIPPFEAELTEIETEIPIEPVAPIPDVDETPVEPASVVDTTPTDPTITSTIPAVMPSCYDREGWLDQEKWLNWTCHAQGDTLPQDLKVRPEGHLSYAVVADTLVENYGWVSNMVVKPKGVIIGGIVTGYISNEGRIENFDFRGRSIIGGTLAGQIVNNSQVDGYFQDVQLAANTEILGGILKGHINGDESGSALLKKVKIAGGTTLHNVTLDNTVQILADSVVLENVFLGPNFQLKQGQVQGNLVGDPEAPAHLDQITIKPGSFVDNVIIGPSVKFNPDEVTFGPGVIWPDSQASETSPSTCKPGQTVKAKRLDNLEESAICFRGHLQTHSGEKNSPATFTQIEAQTLSISVTMTLTATQQNQPGQVLIVGVYQPLEGSGIFYWRDGQTWRVWDGNLDSLTAAEKHEVLPANLEVQIFAGDLSTMPGNFTAYVGIQSEDGLIHFNGNEPIQFEVQKSIE